MMEAFKLQMRTARMLMEAQAVIGMRLMGMAGLLPSARGETTRMVAEKQAAFSKAWMAGATAAMTGASPQAAYARALAPIGRTTRANSRRLARGIRR